MTNTIGIAGYEQDCNCEHCGRPLKHGIRLADGRTVGATCLDKKLTKPKVYHGKKYRLGAERIIHIAKVTQFKPASHWNDYGVAPLSGTFESV